MSRSKKKPKLSVWDKKYDEKTVAGILAEFDEAYDSGAVEWIYPQRGRPSLTGEAAESPTVGFRLSPELRARAQLVAKREGLTLSALARQALEAYVTDVR